MLLVSTSDCGLIHNLIDDLVEGKIDPNDGEAGLMDHMRIRYGYERDRVTKVINRISLEAGYDDILIGD